MSGAIGGASSSSATYSSDLLRVELRPCPELSCTAHSMRMMALTGRTTFGANRSAPPATTPYGAKHPA